MTTPQCKDCRFWQCHLGSWKGWCRRYAPSPLPRSIEPSPTQIVWPETDEEQWCGEFKPRPKPATPEPQEETVSEVAFSALKPWERFCEMFTTLDFIYRAAEAWSDLDGSSLTWFENLGWEKFTKLLADGPGDLRSREWIKRRLLMIHRIGHSKAQMVMDHMAACGWPFRD